MGRGFTPPQREVDAPGRAQERMGRKGGDGQEDDFWGFEGVGAAQPPRQATVNRTHHITHHRHRPTGRCQTQGVASIAPWYNCHSDTEPPAGRVAFVLPITSSPPQGPCSRGGVLGGRETSHDSFVNRRGCLLDLNRCSLGGGANEQKTNVQQAETKSIPHHLFPVFNMRRCSS